MRFALAAFILSTGCTTAPTHPVAPVSVAPVRADIARAQTATGRLDGKAQVILHWLER